jgi:hypothetical protein
VHVLDLPGGGSTLAAPQAGAAARRLLGRACRSCSTGTWPGRC